MDYLLITNDNYVFKMLNILCIFSEYFYENDNFGLLKLFIPCPTLQNVI